MMRRHWTVCAMTALLFGGTAAAQAPGTLLLGGFGQYTKFDDALKLGNTVGGGGRIGAYFAPNWNLEAEDSYNRPEQNGKGQTGRIWYGPVSARVRYSVPLANVAALHVGAGGVISGYSGHEPDVPTGQTMVEGRQNRREYHYGLEGDIGFAISLGGMAALRIDGIIDYMPSSSPSVGGGGPGYESHTNFRAQAGLELYLSPSALFGGGTMASTSGEVMCTFAGLENIPASSPQCVAPAPPPPPPPAMCAYPGLSSITATDPACTPPIAPVAIDTTSLTAPVYFDYNTTAIRLDAAATLKRKIEWLEANPTIRIRIEGNTDDRGSDERNLKLGRRLAEAAKQFLVEEGFDENRFDITSYGEERPVCTEKNARCRQQNRRADFVIVTVGAEAIVTPGPETSLAQGRYPWPPPAPSKRMAVPPKLCTNPRDRTLGGTVATLLGTFRRAQFPEGEQRIYTIGGSHGVAVVGSMEVISKDARFIRFGGPATVRDEPLSISQFIKELFSKSPGRYRFIVIAVTDLPYSSAGVEVADRVMKAIPEGGPLILPPAVAVKTLQKSVGCYALIYEFERPPNPQKTHKVPSHLSAAEHLTRAGSKRGLWTYNELRFP